MIDALIGFVLDEYSAEVIEFSMFEASYYILFSFILAVLSFKLFSEISIQYQSSKKRHLHYFKLFFLNSMFYFIFLMFYEVTIIFYNMFLLSLGSFLFYLFSVLLILMAFYISNRFYLFKSILCKFEQNMFSKYKKRKQLVMNSFILIIVIGDFMVYWTALFYDFRIAFLYTLFLFMIMLVWLVIHKKKLVIKEHLPYLLLLFLFINRINFLFMDLSYGELYYFFDFIYLVLMSLIYYIILRFLRSRQSILLK